MTKNPKQVQREQETAHVDRMIESFSRGVRPATTDTERVQRGILLNNMRHLRSEIEQIFTDAASWNDNSKARKNGAQPIDPDPGGNLRRITDAIDALLLKEHGPPS